jgi:hypothetical protein
VTPEQRAAIEARAQSHREDGSDACWGCHQDWPCDSATFLVALAEAEQREAALVEALELALVGVSDPLFYIAARETIAASRAAREPRP